LTPTVELLEEALRIAMTHERPVYDSLYIALSEREKCVYITADERLVNVVSKSFPKTVWEMVVVNSTAPNTRRANIAGAVVRMRLVSR